MSHKKCLISKVILELIHGIPLSFFVLYINLIYVLHFKPECPKRHISISLLIHISLWQTYLLWIPTSSCVIFIVVSLAMLFSTSNNLMCHIFLILSYVYIFLSESYLSLILFPSCVSSITVSPAMPSTTSKTSSQMPSINGWYSNNQTKQHLPWSVNVSSLLPLCRPPAASHFPH